MEDIKQKVGQQIREARKAKGLTQKELGEKLGVGESAVNKYETGKVNPSVDTLHKIAIVLGAALDISLKLK
ncbi:helix-turn-helix domain-containing protein [Spirosoma sp. HMF3257]|uniref:XRE family transcriptional regulator n=2 Tax=Spirosoma telluris TaxID=2183553 RepID=A0A327NHB8_9BACT|nr:helix-turn-helix domain-containing protein [Spirosoma telluris]RAI73324.1 XRE family transcriptional regulator [Spirosoma telluris]